MIFRVIFRLLYERIIGSSTKKGENIMTIKVTNENKEVLMEALRLYMVARMDHIEMLEKDTSHDNSHAIGLNKNALKTAEDIWSNLRES